jgi:hypothetical protein
LNRKINGALLAKMLLSSYTALDSVAQTINELNVFPVPDGDTGVNMSLTLGAAADAMKTTPENETAGKVAETAARLYLRGARGNSGVILSLLFRGFSKHVKDCKELDALTFAEALCKGVDAAYHAIMKPTEGTILTVSRVSGHAARDAAKAGADLAAMFTVLRASADKALAETIHQNPVLAKAGVVDAGAYGLCVMYQGMEAVLLGKPLDLGAQQKPAGPKVDFSAFSAEEITMKYCTECLITREGNTEDPMPFQAFLDSVGDSLVFVDDDEVLKIHVHSDVPHEIIEHAMRYGTIAEAKVEDMRLQLARMAEEAGAAPPAPVEKTVPTKPIGFVAVSSGDGLAAILKDLGADQIVEGGQTMNPSTEDLLNAVKQTPAETVFVFPGNSNIRMAAEQCAEISHSRRAVVVPTKSVPQTIAALLAYDESASADDNAAIMAEAAKGVYTGQITYAARDSNYDGHDIRAGDYMALGNNALLHVSPDCDEALIHLANTIAGGAYSFINIFYGMDISEVDAAGTAALFRAACPHAEVEVMRGGQAVYYYIVSAEP